MAQYAFGTGTLFGVRTDLQGQTPVQFGAINDVSIDVTFTTKELFGQNQFPLAIARGTGKVTGKAKFARINGATFNGLFFGQNLLTGQKVTSLNEAQSVPAAAPFNVSVANASTFIDDLGVVYQATGLPLTKVTSPSAAGQYSASSSGVYGFSAGDANAALLVSYTYTSAGSGVRMTVSNQLLGASPVFKIVLFETFQGKALQLELLQCVSTKLSLPTKQQDFIEAELDFQAFADPSGNIINLSFAE